MSRATDLGFTCRTMGQDRVSILRHGREVTVLRGAAAQAFLAKAQSASAEALQILCAKVTGNYKRGNERTAQRVRGGTGRGD